MKIKGSQSPSPLFKSINLIHHQIAIFNPPSNIINKFNILRTTIQYKKMTIYYSTAQSLYFYFTLKSKRNIGKVRCRVLNLMYRRAAIWCAYFFAGWRARVCVWCVAISALRVNHSSVRYVNSRAHNILRRCCWVNISPDRSECIYQTDICCAFALFWTVCVCQLIKKKYTNLLRK